LKIILALSAIGGYTPTMKTERITFRVEKKTKEKIVCVAKMNKRDTAEMVRLFVEEALDKIKIRK